MSILLGDNFQYQAAKPLDGRLKYDTLANMKAVGDSTMYDGCLAYCVATDKTYQWKSTNTVDASTGRWREFSSGGGDDANAYHTTDTAETTLADGDYFPFYDTSASGARKSLWSNIKSVLKTYFDSVYQKTLTAGTNISFSGTNNTTINASMPVMGTFSKGDLYDTTEKVIGKWTDGRPIYQKVVQVTVPTTSENGTPVQTNYSWSSLGISNINAVILLEGYIHNTTTNIFRPINLTQTDKDTYMAPRGVGLNASLSDGIVVTNTIAAFSSMKAYVTIRYTKTTDAANSYNYASENDYSTSEKIIGTWIDGKTLYQRTFYGTGPTTINTNTVIDTISSTYNIKEINGYLITSNNQHIPVNVSWPGASFNDAIFCGCIVASGSILAKTNYNTCLNRTWYVTLKYTKS